MSIEKQFTYLSGKISTAVHTQILLNILAAFSTNVMDVFRVSKCIIK